MTKPANFATIGRTKERIPGGWRGVFKRQELARAAEKRAAEREADKWIERVKARKAAK